MQTVSRLGRLGFCNGTPGVHGLWRTWYMHVQMGKASSMSCTKLFLKCHPIKSRFEEFSVGAEDLANRLGNSDSTRNLSSYRASKSSRKGCGILPSMGLCVNTLFPIPKPHTVPRVEDTNTVYERVPVRTRGSGNPRLHQPLHAPIVG